MTMLQWKMMMERMAAAEQVPTIMERMRPWSKKEELHQGLVKSRQQQEQEQQKQSREQSRMEAALVEEEQHEIVLEGRKKKKLG